MTKLSLLAYNTRTGFSNDATRDKLIKLLAELDPDIAFFSDAIAQKISQKELHFFEESFASLGFGILISNNARNDRSDWTRSLGIFRTSLNAKHFYNGFRDETYNVEVKGKCITGRHFDDRNETNRLEVIDDLQDADIIMGDFNAMHRNTLIANGLHALKPIGNAITEINTDVTVVRNPLLRFASLFQRLTRMSEGTMLKKLHGFGFIETNEKTIPTIHGVAQLDHILVKPGIKYSNFKVHKNVKLSDHKPISLDIEF
jgi:hypothetical protein